MMKGRCLRPIAARWPVGSVLLLLLAGVALGFQPAFALDTIRVGKSVPIAWTFTPLDIGVETGIWEKHGLKLDITSFGGDAKVQQALAANGVDFALGSGPGMGFAAKGVPAKAVAAFAGPPDNISIVMGANARRHAVASLSWDSVVARAVKIMGQHPVAA